ncbi:WD-40 repeat protein [Reticulomyxa filosa]|uniref:WD-40 repeat protein n=1 Tax=Reticulomyxa filosa TaxID=46433 RepID=X6NAE3_RETFI|nr:WD-40 repeat protein [Reticulomyxa filosa]|eukprot:ETO22282.1 WD-40 repeat protein [Reticulomyxa filosa]
MFETFRSSSKLINTFTGHTSTVWSIDYSTFDYCQFICSGSSDTTVRVWDVETSKSYMFSMDMKILFFVLIFHHYKAIITMIVIIVKVIILFDWWKWIYNLFWIIG